MKNDVFLSIDCGTQSLRTIIFDVKGNLLAKEKIEYQPYFSEKPGWAEQNAETFWNSLIKGCLNLKEKVPDLFDKISGIGVTAQRDTMICLSKEGYPLRPAITWMDSRKAPQHFTGNLLTRQIFKLIGLKKMLKKTQTDSGGNWIRVNQPEIWERCWKYVSVGGFLNYRLCGNVTDSVASMVGHLPINHKKRRWAVKGDIPYKLFPMPESFKYPLVEAGEIIGRITTKAAQATGLKVGIPLVSCGSDKACETLGVGGLDKTLASLSFGTTATVEVTTKNYFEPLPFLPAYCAALPGRWVPEIEIWRGYWMVSWFKNELGFIEKNEAAAKNLQPEELINLLLDKTPPGNKGLILQPYWGAGLKDPNAKGSIIGFGDVHDRPAIYRAIVEGLGMALREGLEVLERRGNFRAETVAVSGGAGNSDKICQITADIIGRPLVRGRTYETSGLGAAINIAVGIGIYKDYKEAIGEMVHRESVFEPVEENHLLYNQLFGVYKRIYPQLKKLFCEIQEITGYPEL